jgi:hypothetical protein
MFVKVKLLYGTQRRRERNENDSVSAISKYITSVQVEDIRIDIESC